MKTNDFYIKIEEVDRTIDTFTFNCPNGLIIPNTPSITVGVDLLSMKEENATSSHQNHIDFSLLRKRINENYPVSVRLLLFNTPFFIHN